MICDIIHQLCHYLSFVCLEERETDNCRLHNSKFHKCFCHMMVLCHETSIILANYHICSARHAASTTSRMSCMFKWIKTCTLFISTHLHAGASIASTVPADILAPNATNATIANITTNTSAPSYLRSTTGPAVSARYMRDGMSYL